MSDLTAGLQKSSWAGSGDTLKKKYGTSVQAEFMKWFVQRVGILPFCASVNIPENAGGNIILRRLNTDPTIMASIAEGANAAVSARSIMTVDCDITEYGKAHQISKTVAKTGIGEVKRQLRRQMGAEAARDIDDLIYRVTSPLAQGSLPRLDTLAGNHQFFVTTSDGAADGSTVVGTDLNQADNYWKTGTVTPMEGNNAGCGARLIDSSTGATGTLTMLAANVFEYRVLTSTRCLVSRNVGHVVNDPDQVISTDMYQLVRVNFVKNGAQCYDGVGIDDYLNVTTGENPMRGHFFAGLTPGQYADMLRDARYREIAREGDLWKEGWSNYSVYRWFNFMSFELPRQFVVDAPGVAGTAEAQTYQSNGAVHVAQFLAQNAVTVTKIEGLGDGKGAVIIRDKVPGPNTTDQPTDGYGIISVNIWFGTKVTAGPWGFNVATSSTT